ncbi:MAG: hypothetical protein Ct9H300mP32_5430 [Verrucomicrobiota bacterium]|nr:MAG: hypothetical protein Ct9H300mP32_5430 [Verrucomicrobiota bacterium]
MASAVELDWVRNLFPDELTTRAECEFPPGPKRVEAFEISVFATLSWAVNGRRRPIRKPRWRWPRRVLVSGSPKIV